MNDLHDPQDWWHVEPADPHAGLGFLRMALWVLVLIPLLETWSTLKTKFSNQPKGDKHG